MKILRSVLPGNTQITQSEYDLLKFKADGYDRIDGEINRGLEYVNRMSMIVSGSQWDYYDGMNSAYHNIYKELRKNELREGKDRRNLQTVQTGSDDLPW